MNKSNFPWKEDQGCLARIRYMYDNFTATELNIANYILNHPKDIIHLSITQFAEMANCADASIFRFCRRLGYEGYQALKISLAADLVTPLQAIHEEVEISDNMATIAKKVFTVNAETLSDTLQVLDPDSLEQAVNAIAKADRVEFYGCGGSGPIALDAYHKFVRTGLSCIALTDSHLQIVSAGLLKPGSVVVGISHSGSSKDIIDAVQAAKEAGVTTICITDYTKSPLTKISDIVLYTSSRETLLRPESMSCRLAQISILDTLFIGVSMLREEETYDNLAKVRKLIAQKRY
ncbi:MurR/RpiR family transcriptional regulator [Brevibacillus borstelensis]|uniref:MurR/RpiR family transcriptional regulator n=1 Tax=Brevibacillus borstelensis TaxID=45462 RepID=UPI000691AAEA|nr:MurR/RpiR family transcriptional regulator [Brevibacillus borstelensis]